MKRLQSIAKFIIQWGFIALIVVLIVNYIQLNWSQLDVSLTIGDWLWLVIIQLIYVVGMALLPVSSWRLQREFGYKIPSLTVWYIFYVAQFAKYLPGGIWSIPGRAFLYTRQGMDTIESGTLVFLEMLGMMLGAGIVGFLSIPVFAPIVFAYTEWVIVGLVAFIVITFTISYILRSRLKAVKEVFKRVQKRTFVSICVWYMFTWLVIGFAFAGISLVLSESLSFTAIISIVGVHAVAWLAGFVVVFAPGGIGIRDAVLTLGLVPFLPMPLPIIISLLARIAWTFAEVIGFIIILLLKKIIEKNHDETYHTDTLLQ